MIFRYLRDFEKMGNSREMTDYKLNVSPLFTRSAKVGKQNEQLW